MPITSPVSAVWDPAAPSTFSVPDNTIRIEASLPLGSASAPAATVASRAIDDSRHNCAAVARASNGLDCNSSTRSIGRKCATAFMSAGRSPGMRVWPVPRSRVAINIRKMPSASSTFSDNSARNSSAVSESVIDRVVAMIDDAMGDPSRSSSNPSAAGAAIASWPCGPLIVTWPSSRN